MLSPEWVIKVRKMVAGRSEEYHSQIASMTDEQVMAAYEEWKAWTINTLNEQLEIANGLSAKYALDASKIQQKIDSLGQ